MIFLFVILSEVEGSHFVLTNTARHGFGRFLDSARNDKRLFLARHFLANR